MERVQFRVGYEHIFSNSWGGGINQAYAIERTRKILFNEIYARHFSTVGKFSLPNGLLSNTLYGGTNPNFPRVRLRADADYNITIGRKSLRPRLAYELFFNLFTTPN
jgi:hypothetical protein